MTQTSPISLASGVLPEFPPDVLARAAASAGFDAAGIWIEPSTWTDVTTKSVLAALDGAIPVLDAEVIWLKAGEDNPDHLRILDIALALGAANVLVVSSDPHPAATTAKFRRLCEHVEGTNLRVALEFGLFTEVRTLNDALAIIDAAAHRSASLLIDPLHLSRSGGTVADVSRVAPRLLSYAQFCDAPLQMPQLDDVQAIIHEAVDLRLLPGEGALPLPALLDTLPTGIPLSIELRSKALRDSYPDPIERARALAKATRSFLAARKPHH
jgi:sugar phosphate isomerase/epimerase